MGIVLRLLGLLILLAGAALVAAIAWLWPVYGYLPAQPSPFKVERLPENPQIYAVAPEHGYFNINGPSVIRVPDWIENPLGKYYLYFAHHKGSYIRMAYADSPTGPWTVRDGGVLSLADSGFPEKLVGKPDGPRLLRDSFETFSPQVVRDYLMMYYRATVTDPAERKARGITAAANHAAHIASPELVVDEEARELVMFFHGYDERGGQSSAIARSSDGLSFKVDSNNGRLLSTYLRSFEHRGTHYLLGMPGVLFRSDSLTGPYEPRDQILFEPDMRHAGLWLEGDTLYVFWSQVGYAPERLMLSFVDLSNPDWSSWQATAPVDLLLPELPWEGGSLPVGKSMRGELRVPARELRDPFVFQDEDGQLYLYYVGGGEHGIGVARLSPE